jgi:hypothetical protein
MRRGILQSRAPGWSGGAARESASAAAVWKVGGEHGAVGVVSGWSGRRLMDRKLRNSRGRAAAAVL